MRIRVGTLRRYIRESMWFVKLRGHAGAAGNSYVEANDEREAAEKGATDMKLQGILGASPLNVIVEPDQQSGSEVTGDAIDVSSKYTKDTTP